MLDESSGDARRRSDGVSGATLGEFTVCSSGDLNCGGLQATLCIMLCDSVVSLTAGRHGRPQKCRYGHVVRRRAGSERPLGAVA